MGGYLVSVSGRKLIYVTACASRCQSTETRWQAGFMAFRYNRGMPRYRLLATDMDGTLFGHDCRISERTRRALAAWEARGGHVVLATGRMFRATVPYARELGVRHPLVTYQGALIRHHETGEDTWHRTLPRALAAEALEALEATGLHVNLYLDDQLHLRALTPEAESYMALAKVEATMCDDWHTAMAACEPTKIVAIGPEERIVHWVAELQARFGTRLFVTQSQPTFLEVAAPNVGKGAAVAHLAETLGVRREEIVAVGDGMNDLDMIQMAGLGVAMGNAREGLKKAADRVTASVDEDGVAQLIEALISEGAI